MITRKCCQITFKIKIFVEAKTDCTRNSIRFSKSFFHWCNRAIGNNDIQFVIVINFATLKSRLSIPCDWSHGSDRSSLRGPSCWKRQSTARCKPVVWDPWMAQQPPSSCHSCWSPVQSRCWWSSFLIAEKCFAWARGSPGFELVWEQSWLKRFLFQNTF